jgi:hypothetical protein
MENAYREAGNDSISLTFRRNHVDATDAGVRIDATGTKTLHRNRFSGRIGVDVLRGTPTISSNIFQSTTGIRLHGSASMIAHNTFVDTTTGVLCGLVSWPDESTIVNNAFLGNWAGFYATSSCDASLRSNAFYDNDNDVYGDHIDDGANFTQYFALSSTFAPATGLSPLVGAGDPGQGPQRDLYGVRRSAVSPTIGAVERARRR